jgi:hypothetical protein
MAYQTLLYPTARPTGVQNIGGGSELNIVPVQCPLQNGNSGILVGDIICDVGGLQGNAAWNSTVSNVTCAATPGTTVPANLSGLGVSPTALVLAGGKTLTSTCNSATGASVAVASANLCQLVHDTFMGVSTSYRDPTQVTQGTVRDELSVATSGQVWFTLVGNSVTTPGVGNGTTLDGVRIGAGGNNYANNQYCAIPGMGVSVAPYVNGASANCSALALDANNLPCVQIWSNSANCANYCIGTVAKPVLPTDTQVLVNIEGTIYEGGYTNSAI